MVLTYKFDIAPEGDAKEQRIVPRVASLHHQLYDSPLDSMIWRLEDSNGQALRYGGAMHDAEETPLKKGTYTISVLLRHTSRAQLTALKDLTLLLRMPLASPVDCPVFSCRDTASSGGFGGAKEVEQHWLPLGAQSELYICRPSGKLPSWIGPGDVLVGNVALDNGLQSVTELGLAVEMPPNPSKPQEKSGSANATAAKQATESDPDLSAMAEDEAALKKAILKAKLERLAAMRKEGVSRTRLGLHLH